MPALCLIGFMGSGKSSVGAAAARRLGTRLYDLDEVICQRTGVTVPELFARGGEELFRREESAALRWVLDQQPLLLAAGGGAFCSEHNRRLIHDAGLVTVYLDVPWAVIVRRLAGDTQRPLFVDQEAARQLYERRRPAYEQAMVRLRLDGGEQPDQVAAEVVERARSSHDAESHDHSGRASEVGCAI